MHSRDIINNAHLSKGERKATLQMLVEMFNYHTEEDLRRICESHSWQVERCIDFLVNANKHDQQESQRNCGAIPKQKVNNEENPSNVKQMPPTSDYNHITGVEILESSKIERSTVEQRIASLITNGAKVMVLMRGVPGSGKTYLAIELVKRYVSLCDKYTIKDFIFSSDDFFYNSSGQYKWQAGLLDQAHNFNQCRVTERALAGWSPIFIDNTNIKLWEMLCYAQTAVKNGYVIELLEPRTSWRKSAYKLAQKNIHGVSAEKIQGMLNKFENGTVNDLLKMLHKTKYTVRLPQMRSIPPIQLARKDTKFMEELQIYQSEGTVQKSSNEQSIEDSAPKPQRDKSGSRKNNNSEIIGSDMPYLLNNETDVWEPHEYEVKKFLCSETRNDYTEDKEPQEYEAKGKCILDLFRENLTDGSKWPKDDNNEETLKSSKNFERHSINCANENKGFASLRQIYPNKEISSLWDLFVKCDGDIDWTVDLLLREEELMEPTSKHNFDTVPEQDNFLCNCIAPQSISVNFNDAKLEALPVVTPLGIGTKPQRQRVRSGRIRPNRKAQEITDLIANRFVLDDEKFSPHVRKVREMREKLREPCGKHYANAETQTDQTNDAYPTDENADGDSSEIIEINLGEEFVQHLKKIFQDEFTSLVERLPDNPAANVFMPRSLAKELYMLWVESAYNQLEEQKHRATRADANFARLLKNPKYENCSESPGNIEELLDMELAWEIFKNDNENKTQTAINEQHFHRPNDLASHLTELKLCENFPSIPPETLLEILSAHGNDYDKTVRVLKIMTQPVEDLQQELLKSTFKEQEIAENQQENTKNARVCKEHASRAPLQPDEMKRKALHDFEEMRNLAAHHCQLKAECYQKAKYAIQKGNSSVAVYYSQIANLHKMKIDMYNHRAANCIMDVHKYTKNNPELLDLHYLHVMEAIGCLDLFLDRHITGLRTASRTYKHLFIITGRGLHSTGGVSTIKNKVKSRLKDRNLR